MMKSLFAYNCFTKYVITSIFSKTKLNSVVDIAMFAFPHRSPFPNFPLLNRSGCKPCEIVKVRFRHVYKYQLEHDEQIKKPFDPSDPKWPQVDIWPHNKERGFETDMKAYMYDSESYGHAM